MLDQAMEELFVPYMEGNRYLEKEGKSLTELYAGKLLRFTNWHVRLIISSSFLSNILANHHIQTQRAMNKAKPSNTIFDRMVNQLTTAAHQAATNAKELVPEPTWESSRLDRLMKLSGLSSNPKEKEKNMVVVGVQEEGNEQLMFQDGDGALDLGVAQKMLKWHAEAVGRMVELSKAGDV